MNAVSLIPSYNTKLFDTTINELYSSATSKVQNWQRVQFFSQYFLNTKYLAHPCGEGVSGMLDQNPLYRTDAFDCLTFVNTVLALAHSRNLEEFHHNILKINYYHSLPLYENRFHFMSIDWNVENEKNGFIRDITETLVDEKGQPICLRTDTLIDRAGWFRARTLSDIKLIQPVSKRQATQLLQKLHALGAKLGPKMSQMFYAPFHRLFENRQPNYRIFSQIPNASVLQIVRPEWHLREKIGTDLNVSHLGFVFNEKSQLIFRHAALNKTVQDVRLIEYLVEISQDPTIKGITVFAV